MIENHTIHTMNCPKCKTIDLRKRGFDSPFNCHKCGGTWLESEKIPEFIESSSYAGSDLMGESLNDDVTGLCPSGHGIMIRARIDIEETFYLEKCSSCGGIWFDNGEWHKLINSDLAGNISEFWCKSWQQKQRQEKSRASYLESNRKILGDDVFENIIRLSKILRDHPEKGRAIALLQQEL